MAQKQIVLSPDVDKFPHISQGSVASCFRCERIVNDKLNFRSHRMHHFDTAYCYRHRTFCDLCDCVFWVHQWAFRNGWTFRADVGLQSREGPENYILDGCILAPFGEYDWTIRARRRCGFASNYFDYLLKSVTESNSKKNCEIRSTR